jgi:sigma-B regulation protein RsbU (phosphoserine phosphatase)
MQERLLDRVRKSLLGRRENLTTWFDAAPPEKKQNLLGPATKQAVDAHLRTLDTALDKAESGTLGRCEVCNDFVEADLLEMDYTCCVCLDHLSAEEARHLEHELELAQEVQRTLLPQQLPEIPSVEIAAFSRPAQIVGGDYFDFFRYEHGTHGLAIADVAGHGVSTSLHMASVQTLLRTLVPTSRSPVQVVRQLHDLYTHNIQFSTFVTLFLGALDAKNLTLSYCNAGHNPPLILRRQEGQEDSVIWLQPTGPALGLVEAMVYSEASISLQPGDVLLLYTDGVTEAANPKNELLGQGRLAARVAEASGRSAGELIQLVRQELQRFTAGRPLEDDTTIVVCKLAEKAA